MVVNVDGRGARALSNHNLRWGRWVAADGKTILSGAGVGRLISSCPRADRWRRDQDDRDPFGRQAQDGVLRKLVPRWRVDLLLRKDLERRRSLHRAGGRHEPPPGDRHTRRSTRRTPRRLDGCGSVRSTKADAQECSRHGGDRESPADRVPGSAGPRSASSGAPRPTVRWPRCAPARRCRPRSRMNALSRVTDPVTGRQKAPARRIEKIVGRTVIGYSGVVPSNSALWPRSES